MNKVTFILGPQGSSKTTKVQQMSTGKNCLSFTSMNNLRADITKQTQLIIVEDVANIGIDLKQLITADILRRRIPYRETSEAIKRPEVVITSNVLNKRNIRHRDHFVIVEL